MKSISFIYLCIVLIIFCPEVSNGQHQNPGAAFNWKYSTPQKMGISAEKLEALKTALMQKGTKKLLIIKNDSIICEAFAKGWEDSVAQCGTASLAKALVSGMALNTAISDGYITADTVACTYIPMWQASILKSQITIRQLATHTSGIEDAEASEDELKQLVSEHKDMHMGLPGWKGMFWRRERDPFSLSRDSAKILFKPGSASAYSNPGIAMLNYCVTKSIQKSSCKNIKTYLYERVFNPIGIKKSSFSIGYNTSYKVDGMDLFAGWGGATFTADAVARIGRLILKNGNWQGHQILDSTVIKKALTIVGKTNLAASSGFDLEPAAALGWFTNVNGTFKLLPRDAFFGAGAGEQLLLVIPCLNLIVVRMGTTMNNGSTGEGYWQYIENHIFNPIAATIEKK